MSYLVLARKWRPQQFEDLIGQEHVSRTLANAIASDRVHHAFLFTGARGVGKTSAARIFAKALNCEKGLTAQPCGVCPTCEAVTAGNDVDVFEIDGASNTGVDDIRELRDNIRYLPSRSRFKIFIIDEVHMLSISAFNALLKTLEEPPPHAKFIFATTEPQKIPVTILSRCQRFDFRKIAQAQVSERLRHIATAEGIDISPQALQWVAKAGGGSMRDSLSTLDQVLAFCGETVQDDDVRALLGAVDHRLLLDVAEAMIKGDSRRVLDGLRRVDEQGYSWRQFCRELVELCRNLMVFQVVQDPAELLDVTDAQMEDVRQLGQASTLEQLQRILTLLMQAEADIAYATFPRLVLELALLRLTEMPDAQSLATLLNKLDHLQGRLGEVPVSSSPAGGSSSAVPASSAPPVAPPPVEEPFSAAAESLPEAASPSPPVPSAPVPAKPLSADRTSPDKGGWEDLVNFVRTKRPSVSAHLDHARLMEFELPVIVLGYPDGSFHLTYMSEAENTQNLEALATDFFKQPVKVRIKPLAADAEIPPSLAETRQAEQKNRREKLQADAEGHPLVQSAVEIFEGRIEQVDPIQSDE